MNDYLAASNATSLLDMANGAIKERIDYEMGRVMQNISDPNTKAEIYNIEYSSHEYQLLP